MDIPRNWRLQKQRYGLIGEVCGSCDEKIFPPRDICPCCNGEAKKPFQFSGRGEIYSFTHVIDPPEGFDENASYTIAIIELEEGPKLTAQLTDLQDLHGTELHIGMPVEMVTRKIRSTQDERGMLIYGYKFRPPLTTKKEQEFSAPGKER